MTSISQNQVLVGPWVCDSVICAAAQVAADSRVSEFLGKSERAIGHVVLAAQQGLGEIDYRRAGI